MIVSKSCVNKTIDELNNNNNSVYQSSGTEALK